MKVNEQQTQEKIIEMLGIFTNRLIKTGYCKLDNINFTSIDHWGSNQNDLPDDKYLILVVQYCNSIVRYFNDGIKQDIEKPANLYGSYFLRDSNSIQRVCNKLLQNYKLNINIELWLHDLIRNLCIVDGILKKQLGIKEEF